MAIFREEIELFTIYNSSNTMSFINLLHVFLSYTHISELTISMKWNDFANKKNNKVIITKRIFLIRRNIQKHLRQI